MFDTESLARFFETILMRTTGQELEVLDYTLVTGGDINTAVCLKAETGLYFVKFRELDNDLPYEQEAKGLRLLYDKLNVEQFRNEPFDPDGPFLNVPQVLGHGHSDGYGYLVLEFVESRLPNRQYWVHLGKGLSQLHKVVAKQSGLNYNNHLGSLAQSNRQHLSWPDFWGQERLIPLAGRALLEELLPLSLYKRIEALALRLADHLPATGTSLLHGDLWTGNVMADHQGRPMLIDPAIYYGHREVDLAMTRLFGGFPTLFYDAYNDALPLEPGWSDRMELYTLYPLLVHVNLFGAAYIPGIEKVLGRFGA